MDSNNFFDERVNIKNKKKTKQNKKSIWTVTEAVDDARFRMVGIKPWGSSLIYKHTSIMSILVSVLYCFNTLITKVSDLSEGFTRQYFNWDGLYSPDSIVQISP